MKNTGLHLKKAAIPLTSGVQTERKTHARLQILWLYILFFAALAIVDLLLNFILPFTI